MGTILCEKDQLTQSRRTCFETMNRLSIPLSLIFFVSRRTHGWLPLYLAETRRQAQHLCMSNDGPVEYNDFDDFIGDSFDINQSFAPSTKEVPEDNTPVLDDQPTEVVPLPQLVPDRSACRTRRFSLGREVVLDRYLGTLGFQEVTDWQYYMTDQDEDGNLVGNRREKVSPNPLDPKQPRRTRQSSGSVLRLFRGEFVSALGGLLRRQGLENRVLIKEFSGDLGLALADRETRALAQFQSRLVSDDDDEDWRNDAMNRFNNPRTDNMRVQKMIKQAGDCPFTVLIGEVDLAEVEEEGWDANEVRALQKVVCFPVKYMCL